jgi:hypothetical protein
MGEAKASLPKIWLGCVTLVAPNDVLLAFSVQLEAYYYSPNK